MGQRLLTVNDALELSQEDAKNLYKEYVNPSFAQLVTLLRFDRRFIRAQGTSLWDEEGEEYLDCLGAFGALNLGHNPPQVIEAIRMVEERPNLLQVGLNGFAAVLAYNLAQLTPGNLKHTFFCNSGAEAVEGALKLARISTGKTRLVYTEGGFHGKTFGALSVTGRAKYQNPFSPLLPGCKGIPYGDAAALEDELKNGDVAGFIVEPIQGEGGVVVPPEGYLKRCQNICHQYGALLIVDEVQTGFGRTGKLFACEHEGVTPDIMCLAKSLGGGIMPIGAYIATPEVWTKAYGTVDKALLHTSTFGGNTRAAVAGIAALNAIIEQNLPARAAELGDYLKRGLADLAEKHHLITDVRGKGLLIGVEFAKPEGLVNKLTGGLAEKISTEYLASMIAVNLLNDHNIITAYTLNNPNVIRLEPPLVVTREQIDYLLKAMAEVLKQNRNLISTGLNTAKAVLAGVFRRR